MRIIVCVKQVPNTTEIRIDPVTNTLIRDGVASIINPDDNAALEYALRLKETVGATVTTITMGPPQAEAMLRQTLAKGADHAVLLTDRAFAGSDTLATSTIISSAIDKIGYDLVLAGRQAIDGDTAQVGAQIAEMLSLPQVSYVGGIEADKDKLIVKRVVEDGYQKLAVRLPALLTVLGDSVTPRYMNVYDIVAQEDKQVEVITFADLAIDKANIGLAGSPTKVKSTFTRNISKDKKQIDGTAQEAVDAIITALVDKQII